MRDPGGTAAALVPALLVALFGAWCGTDWGSSGSAGAVAGEAVLLAAALAAGTSGFDPLRLGPLGRLLPLALWILAAASAWASPVPRAGRTALALLPAFYLLPGAVARCWRDERARRIGLRGLSMVVGSVALGSLVAIPWRGIPRASLPLGHHNLLAAWLVLLLPLAVLPVREKTSWRWLGWATGLSALAAVAASRSLAGAFALAAEALLAGLFVLRRPVSPPPSRVPADRGSRTAAGGPERAEGPGPRSVVLPARAGLPAEASRSSAAHEDERPVPDLASRRRRRTLLLVAGLAAIVLLTFQVPRLLAVRAGTDLSLRARLVYLEGGWRGFLARPFLGWGPGSTPWTAAAFLRPEPGVNPPGEVVGELHSLPLQLLYELGATGGLLALGLAAVFLRRRLSEVRVAADRPLLAAGLLGLAGGAAAALANAAWAVTALPVAAAMAAGGALAASPRAPELAPARRWLALAYAAAAALALASPERARLHYERAIAAGAPGEARRELARAVELDPAFPLYGARLVLLEDRSPRGRAAGAELSRRAALGAPGAGALWLIAGLEGAEADRPWTGDALARACALDPLSAFAPFLLARSDPEAPDAAALAARAILAEPRLGAATFWDSHEDLLLDALEKALRREGVDPGYRDALTGAVRRANLLGERGERVWLAFTLDRTPALSLSLHAFRRRPWAARWEVVRLWRAPLDELDLPAATALPTSSPSAFPPCPVATAE